ncbi:MAG: hypothetical protein LBI53_01770 [Candidatus Peribacteria bacterium]|jgi:hypothetical protein|nr:hypothetical protein [Candidatus Peribacteria bacterium]
MHLFRILERSLATPNECRFLRENLTRLNKLIGKEDIIKLNETVKKPESEADDKPLNQQDEKMLDNLSIYFNTQKRETDLRQLNTPEDSSNGIYTFLREFTTDIDEKASTNHNENQKLDLNKMSTHLSALEQQKAEQDLITHYRKIDKQVSQAADIKLERDLENLT